MIRSTIFLFSILLLFFDVCSQKEQSYTFRSPLNIPLVLAANFGELRPNHFHMGLDFKTNGVEGLPLFSVEEGYISRVKISTGGYGKAVYIAHPNGITSVYAHCSRFIGKLDSLVQAIQKKEQNSEIEIYLTADDVIVKKGEQFALTGNTGSSTAPHLHFELRDTETEAALNPLLYGFSIADTRSPEIRSLKVYSLTNEGYMIPGKSKTIPIVKGTKNYSVSGNQVVLPSNFCSLDGGVGFSVETVDYFNAANNVCGIYKSALILDEDTLFRTHMHKIHFEHSRYINSHKDFEEYKFKGKKMHKTFKTLNNPLTIYDEASTGLIYLKPGDSAYVKIIVADVAKNQANVQFKLKIEQGNLSSIKDHFPHSTYFHPDSAYFFQNAQVAVAIPRFTFYEPCLKQVKLQLPITVANSKIPIQEAIEIKIKSNQVFDQKVYIGLKDDKGRKHALTTSFHNGWYSAQSKTLGSFNLYRDTIAPHTSPLNFTGNEPQILKSKLTWRVLENETSLADYDLFIDGEWHLLEYEPKGDYLYWTKPSSMKGMHSFQLVLKDQCGNVSYWDKKLSF